MNTTNTQNRSVELAADALSTLIKALEAGNSEALTNYLGVMARFYQYSWNNCLLISSQRPNATHVAGFHAWHKFGRSVRKGEKGIMILAPVIVKREISDEHSTTNDSATVLKKIVGFRAAYVFDVLFRVSDPHMRWETCRRLPSDVWQTVETYLAKVRQAR